MRAAVMAIVLVGMGVSAAPARAQEKPDFKTLDAMVEKALAAYNAEDSKKFFADFAKAAPFATEEYFKNFYVERCKKDLGNYVTRKLIKDKSTLEGIVPVLWYEAEYTKMKPVFIAVVFQKEDGKLKIIQIGIESK